MPTQSPFKAMPRSNPDVVLLLAALLQLSVLSSAVWVPLGDVVPAPEVLLGACRGQGHRTVCYPTNTVTQYLQCRPGEQPLTRTCQRGQAYDYLDRRCRPTASVRPCPWWPVPQANMYSLPTANNTGGPSFSAPIGDLFTPGNFTMTLEKAGHLVVFIPLNGLNLLGQHYEVEVSCPAPADRVPFTFDLLMQNPTQNNVIYPRRGATVYASCGDQLFIHWMFPPFFSQVLDISPDLRSQWRDVRVMARPVQPLYRCPMYNYMPDPSPEAAPGSLLPIPNPGDQVIRNPGFAPWNATITPNVSSTFFLFDPAGAYCRMGLVFKVTVLPPAVGHTNITVDIAWQHENNLLEDVIITVGDSIFIHKDSPFQESALFRTANIPLLNEPFQA